MRLFWRKKTGNAAQNSHANMTLFSQAYFSSEATYELVKKHESTVVSYTRSKNWKSILQEI